MAREVRLLAALLLAAFAGQGQTVCAECHPAVAQRYKSTGMGRSFSKPEPEKSQPYYHAPSDTWFEMIVRDGKYLQRQYRIGADGKQTNVSETQVDYVMGSGDHARTWLHRTPRNELIELPLGWYAEAGGTWAMNPGYDRPDHASLSRTVPYGCMFCHNAYPQIPPAKSPRANPVFESVPEGIDCQRCHGDGSAHVQLARTPHSPREAIRAAIVNPASLSPERGMEVCLQCHLEPKSASTSSLIVRYEREPFSFKPGEPLADFRLHFDLKGNADRFEVVGAGGYRLMQSQCFLQSKGALTCITCHDPHTQATPDYSAACLNCHREKLAQNHPPGRDCVTCHMPKRRTEDAIHVVMTDHLIQRNKPTRDLLAPLHEALMPEIGKPVAWYPPVLTGPDRLYPGIAEISETGTRPEGIARLKAAIDKTHPAAAEYYLQLGDALRASRRFDEAIPPYEEAVRREPQSAIAHQRLAFGLTRVKQFARADVEFKQAQTLAPGDATILKDTGLAYLEQARIPEAAAAFTKAIAIDSTLHEAHNGLGGARLKLGDRTGAEAEFREAIRLRPNYAEAHHNLGWLLSAAGRFDEATYHFEESIRFNPNHAETHYDFATMLDRANRPTEAVAQFRQALKINPESERTNLSLGAALIHAGQIAEARSYVEKAASSRDAAIRSEARKLLDYARVLP